MTNVGPRGDDPLSDERHEHAAILLALGIHHGYGPDGQRQVWYVIRDRFDAETAQAILSRALMLWESDTWPDDSEAFADTTEDEIERLFNAGQNRGLSWFQQWNTLTGASWLNNLDVTNAVVNHWPFGAVRHLDQWRCDRCQVTRQWSSDVDYEMNCLLCGNPMTMLSRTSPDEEEAP